MWMNQSRGSKRPPPFWTCTEEMSDIDYIGWIGEIHAEEEDVREAIRSLNAACMKQDALSSSEMPVPAEPTPLDEISIHVARWKECHKTNMHEVLDSELVHKAMLEEIAYMEKIPVWHRVKKGDFLPDDNPIPTKWALTWKDSLGEVSVTLVAC